MKYVFVDIDGVLNPDILRSGGFHHLASPYGESGPKFMLQLHPVYGKWLRELSEETESFLVWGSTWQEFANEWVGRHLDLPHLSHLELKPAKFSESLGCTKARAAVEYAQNYPFIYLDDEPDLQDFLDRRRPHNGRHIRVDPERGLTSANIVEARKLLGERSVDLRLRDVWPGFVPES